MHIVRRHFVRQGGGTHCMLYFAGQENAAQADHLLFVACELDITAEADCGTGRAPLGLLEKTGGQYIFLVPSSLFAAARQTHGVLWVSAGPGAALGPNNVVANIIPADNFGQETVYSITSPHITWGGALVRGQTDQLGSVWMKDRARIFAPYPRSEKFCRILISGERAMVPIDGARLAIRSNAEVLASQVRQAGGTWSAEVFLAPTEERRRYLEVELFCKEPPAALSSTDQRKVTLNISGLLVRFMSESALRRVLPAEKPQSAAGRSADHGGASPASETRPPASHEDGAWAAEQGFYSVEPPVVDLGLTKPFRWTQGSRSKLRIFSARRGARRLDLALRNSTDRQSLTVSLNGAAATVSGPLAADITADQHVSVEVEAKAGWNQLEISPQKPVLADEGRLLGVIVTQAGFDGELRDEGASR